MKLADLADHAAAARAAIATACWDYHASGAGDEITLAVSVRDRGCPRIADVTRDLPGAA